MKALPCLINGHEPFDEKPRTTFCKWCNVTLEQSSLWTGMKSKKWWTAHGEKWVNMARQGHGEAGGQI